MTFMEKVKWLERRGYEMTDGEMLKLVIILVKDNRSSAYFTTQISVHSIDKMTIEELQEFDTNAWLDARSSMHEYFGEGFE